MLKGFATTVKRHSWSLSLLLHVLLLIIYLLTWLHTPKSFEEKSSELYIPSYLYKPPAPTPTPLSSQSAVKEMQSQTVLHDKPITKEGLRTERSQTAYANEATRINREQREVHDSSKETEAVHLIGDKKINQPLIVLLGKAIYKHLIFPKSAIDFNIRGISSIGFVVHPNGGISNVSVVKSSGADVLDRAALTAIMEISPVNHVDQYIKEPTYLVANIIFR